LFIEIHAFLLLLLLPTVSHFLAKKQHKIKLVWPNSISDNDATTR